MLPSDQGVIQHPAVWSTSETRQSVFPLLKREEDGCEPIRRADGIAVCLVCLKSTAGEARGQTSQLHGPECSQNLPHLLLCPDTSRFDASFQQCAAVHFNTVKGISRSPLVVIQYTTQLQSTILTLWTRHLSCIFDSVTMAPKKMMFIITLFCSGPSWMTLWECVTVRVEVKPQ